MTWRRRIHVLNDTTGSKFGRVPCEAIDVIVMRLGGLMRLGGATLAERGLHAIGGNQGGSVQRSDEVGALVRAGFTVR